MSIADRTYNMCLIRRLLLDSNTKSHDLPIFYFQIEDLLYVPE